MPIKVLIKILCFLVKLNIFSIGNELNKTKVTSTTRDSIHFKVWLGLSAARPILLRLSSLSALLEGKTETKSRLLFPRLAVWYIAWFHT